MEELSLLQFMNLLQLHGFIKALANQSTSSKTLIALKNIYYMEMAYDNLKSHIRVCMYTSYHAYEHCTEFILNYVSGKRINSDFTKVTSKTSHISFDVITKGTRSNN